MDVASVLILIAVIGILVVLGFVLLGGGRAKLRDEAEAARKSPGSDDAAPVHHAIGTPEQLEELGQKRS